MLETPVDMFEDVIYDRALFNMNTWKGMTITPRHGRSFCEVTFDERKLYMEKEEFRKDAKNEYDHLSNALLMLRLVHAASHAALTIQLLVTF